MVRMVTLGERVLVFWRERLDWVRVVVLDSGQALRIVFPSFSQLWSGGARIQTMAFFYGSNFDIVCDLIVITSA